MAESGMLSEVEHLRCVVVEMGTRLAAYEVLLGGARAERCQLVKRLDDAIEVMNANVRRFQLHFESLGHLIEAIPVEQDAVCAPIVVLPVGAA